MAYEFLQIARDGHVATITLNRPDRLNALSRELTSELHRALDELGAEFPDTRAVIITGAGRGFCSGADVNAQADALNQPAQQQQEQRAQVSESGYDLTSIPPLAPHIRSIPQPVIAAVNGVAAGAGFSIALASAIRVASQNARFSCIFVKRSLVPDTASSYTMTTLAGTGVAAEMALTGRVYDVDWAFQRGLVNYVVPQDQLMAKAREIADEIAGNPPICVKQIKQLMYQHGADLDQVINLEHHANDPIYNTADRREAVMSFVEKREPVYQGR